MIRLYHLSDVHFGPPHRAEVAAAALGLIERRRPDLVVVSGDLTQRAKPAQFRQAREFVDRIPAPTIVVPGNHDVPLYRVWERVFSPFGAYRRHFSTDLEPVYRQGDLAIIGINTAHGWTLKDGRIPLARLLEVAELLDSLPERCFKVVVAHHQLIPSPSFGSQRVMVNAFEAVEVFSRGGVDLVLSGHLHQAYVGSSEEFFPSGRAPVRILHSGTSTSSRGRGHERGQNTSNWIEISHSTVTISHLVWHSGSEVFTERSRHLFPRRPEDSLGEAEAVPEAHELAEAAFQESR